MYVTSDHVCFYAHLPRKEALIKAGYISKTGRRNPKYSRYWFTLKSHVLTYSSDASNVYFPSGQIDLRHAIAAQVSEKDREGTHFTIQMPHRTYYLRAGCAPSASDWVKCIQRVILRLRNDGDSVKVSLPIENIVDLEVVPMADFAETCRLRVIDNEETYSIDEYYFSFFSMGQEVMHVLKILIEDRQSRNREEDRERFGRREEEAGAPAESVPRQRGHLRNSSTASAHARSGKLTEAINTTLLLPPLEPPITPRRSSEAPHSSRSSADVFKSFQQHRSQGSADVSSNAATTTPTGLTTRKFSPTRRIFSGSRIATVHDSEKSWDQQASTESYVQPSMSVAEDGGLSGMAESSASVQDQSASQILRASDIFLGPTLRRGERSILGSEEQQEQQEQQDQQQQQEQQQEQQQHEWSPEHKRHRSRSSSPSPVTCMSSPISTSPPNVSTGGFPSEPHGSWKPQNIQAHQNGVARLGTSPLQRASAWANLVNQAGRRVGSMLATESMGYVEKVSGMWKGGRRHYSSDASGVERQPGEHDESAPEKIAEANDRFRRHFLLPQTERLQSSYFGYIIRVLPLYGKLYISNSYLCFRSLLPGTNTKLVLPFRDMENAEKENGFRFGYHGLVLVVRAHEELFFEFKNSTIRDDCAVTLLRILDRFRFLKESDQLTDRDEGGGGPVIVSDDMTGSLSDYKPPRQGMHITCLTIGSRGDVQPYIALAKGLMAEGHTVRIATHAEFQPWIEGHGIEFRVVAGDPAELMRLCIDNGTWSLGFIRQAHLSFRAWLDEVLTTAWEACRGTELLIESPSAMAGIHVAEALDIPYFRAFTMPWTRTRAYPHAFITPSNKMGGTYNMATYVLFESMFWHGMQGQVNKWRTHFLGLPPTSYEKLQINKVPFLYNFSPLVVPPPLDYSDWIRVTGYWFLDEGSDWRPAQELLDFIAKARGDGKRLVYIGFGSIIVSEPAKWIMEMVDAVLKADVRCILSTGWSDRLTGQTSQGVAVAAAAAATQTQMQALSQDHAQELSQVVIPPEIHVIKSAPHDWLFAQVDAAAHHGGSGTTGASLRAGIPTIIRPFFGDQFFFANRVEDTGVGIYVRKPGSMPFARALWRATHDERMITKARALGESIRKVSFTLGVTRYPGRALAGQGTCMHSLMLTRSRRMVSRQPSRRYTATTDTRGA